jgi:hypothetical protein
LVDACGAIQGIFGHASDSQKKIFQPIVPRASFADAAQPIVIVAPRRFKEGRQIEQWRRKDLALNQEQSYK